MAVDEWHSNCHQFKMQMCSLSVAYACPYHNPTTIIGHSVHNIDISKPLFHTTSAICPIQLKLRFIHEEHTSPVCLWPSKVCICPLKSVTMPNCSHVKILVKFVQKFFTYANPQFSQMSWWLVSDDPIGEESGCGGPGLALLHVALRL